MNILSFVIIGYNIEKYIENCINSIINQSKENIEIIFIDDGSNDKTADIVKKIFEYDSRCKYIYQNNKGANAARINGFKHAKGKYICFIDGDDSIDENLAKISIERFEKEKIDMFCYNFNFIYENGTKIINKKFNEKKYNEYDFLEDILLSKTPHYLWNKVYRYEFLKEMNFENIPCITMGDDLMANVRIGLAKPKVSCLNSPLYSYYLKKTSVSQNFNSKYIEIIYALKDIEENLYKSGLKQRYSEMIEFQYFKMFYYYVVKSKYKKDIIHLNIRQAWKNKNIKINRNKYIKEFINNISLLEKILFYLYNFNFKLGYILSRIYIKLTGI